MRIIVKGYNKKHSPLTDIINNFVHVFFASGQLEGSGHKTAGKAAGAYPQVC
jgi:hypothetical protein